MLISLSAKAQNSAQEELNYTKTLDQRASRILNTMQIGDSLKYHKVKGLIVDQYRALNAIHEDEKKQVAAIDKETDKNIVEAKRKSIEEATSRQLAPLHDAYLNKLAAELTSEQVNAVKDGMTFNVLSVTTKAYQDMIPSLTAEEKGQINSWLVEARELAMDAGSSEDKHRIFGKYKGRINNYLAKRGYDLQKERAAWNARSKR
ncbi:DUF3826 domain-containing protein [Dyadobacter sp. UC 10]|nr:DUF3826 domain-containing protein [Dyadobacter sp. UC 10]